MKTIFSLLNIQKHDKIAVVGCGGKTGLIELLAAQAPSSWSVLVSPTTKIAYPVTMSPVLTNQATFLNHAPVPGVQYAGNHNLQTGKLVGFAPDFLAQKADAYTLLLMEADGSAQQPCKGWQENEPVVPLYTTQTVGVVSLAALQQPASDNCVWRLPLFLQLTNLAQNQPIFISALARMVGEPNGMFKNAVGVHSLVINQVETPLQHQQALQLIQELQQLYPTLLQQIVVGSVHNKQWQAYLPFK